MSDSVGQVRRSPPYEALLIVFFAWIAVEDQVRKSLDNPLVVYLTKDVLLAIVLYRCVTGRPRNARRIAVPHTLPVLLLWGFLLHVLGAFNPQLTNPLAALIGIKLTFSYIPLLYVGYRYVEDGGRIERFSRAIVVVGVVIGLMGTYQATADPTFLNPEPAGGLEGAQLRWRREGVEYVTATFLSPGRYVFYLLNVFAVGTYLLLAETRRWLRVFWLVAMSSIAVSLTTSGARLGLAAFPLLLGSLAFTVASARLRSWRTLGRRRSGSGLLALVLLALLCALTLWLASALSPAVDEALVFYWDSFFSHGAEGFWDRQIYHVDEITKADWITLVFGRGTGSASFGVGYLENAPEILAEGGYAAAIWELGVLGLVFYCALAWQLSAIFLRLETMAAPGTAPAALMAAFTPLFLFELWYVNVLGPVLQQYVVAVFLWFFAGVFLATVAAARGLPAQPTDASGPA